MRSIILIVMQREFTSLRAKNVIIATVIIEKNAHLIKLIEV